jgi:hypothetical protein
MNSSDRIKAATTLSDEQRSRFERAGKEWPGPMCEVEAARLLNDTEFLQQAWTKGKCKGDLVIDHIDNNNDNNPVDGSDWQWLCRSHNVKKDPPKAGRSVNRFLDGKGLEQSLYRNNNRDTETIGQHECRLEREWLMPATMKKNRESEPVFRKAVKALIAKYGRMKRRDLLNAACEKAQCVQCTGANYLEKMCSVCGDYEYEEDKHTGELWVKIKNSKE